MSKTRLLKRHQPDEILTIEISRLDLYHILYRLKHQDREHNVFPDLSAEPAARLAEAVGLDLRYREDLY